MSADRLSRRRCADSHVDRGIGTRRARHRRGVHDVRVRARPVHDNPGVQDAADTGDRARARQNSARLLRLGREPVRNRDVNRTTVVGPQHPPLFRCGPMAQQGRRPAVQQRRAQNHRPGQRTAGHGVYASQNHLPAAGVQTLANPGARIADVGQLPLRHQAELCVEQVL